jgi:predicted metal-binding protein
VTACAGIGWTVIIGISKLVEDRCSTRCEDGCDRLGNCLVCIPHNKTPANIRQQSRG